MKIYYQICSEIKIKINLIIKLNYFSNLLQNLMNMVQSDVPWNRWLSKQLLKLPFENTSHCLILWRFNSLFFFFVLWCQCCRWCSHINKQPEIQKFWNLCGCYKDIYDWISPLMVYSNTDSNLYMGESSMVNPDTCLFFISLKHLMVSLKYNFMGLYFLTLLKTLIPCTTMKLRFCFMWKQC